MGKGVRNIRSNTLRNIMIRRLICLPDSNRVARKVYDRTVPKKNNTSFVCVPVLFVCAPEPVGAPGVGGWVGHQCNAPKNYTVHRSLGRSKLLPCT
jgi:hypothetical protein